MQISLRAVSLDKPSVSEWKTILISWTSFFQCRGNVHPSGHQYHPLNVEKITVWWVSGRNGIIRPYWFEGAEGRPVRVSIE